MEQMLGRALETGDAELYLETEKFQDVSVAKLSRAIAEGTVIYSNDSKRVIVVRFATPGSGQPHAAKAIWLDDSDPRSEALGALVCAEMGAYKILQARGSCHPNVGRLDAVMWVACGAEGGGCGCGGGAVPGPQQQAGDTGPAAAAGSLVILLQPFYGRQTLDSYVVAHVAASRRRRPMAPGSPELERMLQPLLAGVARAIAYAHSKGLILRDFKPGNVLIDDSSAGDAADAAGSGAAAAGGASAHPLGRQKRSGSGGGGGGKGGSQGCPVTPVLVDFDGALPDGEAASGLGAGGPPGDFAYTPPYVAPEVARAALQLAAASGAPPRVTAAAMALHGAKGDVFAFGVAAWQLAHASGRGVPYPFARDDPTFSDDSKWIGALVEDAVPVSPMLSPPLVRLIVACLDKDPASRPTMEEALAMVGEWGVLLHTEAVLGPEEGPAAGDGAAPPLARAPGHEGGCAASWKVPVCPQQVLLDQWRLVGPCGEQSAPVTAAALWKAFRAGRVGGVTPVVVWAAGCWDPALVPLATMAPLLARAARMRRPGTTWAARLRARCCCAAQRCRSCGCLAPAAAGGGEGAVGFERDGAAARQPGPTLQHECRGANMAPSGGAIIPAGCLKLHSARGAPVSRSGAEPLRRKARQWGRRVSSWCRLAPQRLRQLAKAFGRAAARRRSSRQKLAGSWEEAAEPAALGPAGLLGSQEQQGRARSKEAARGAGSPFDRMGSWGDSSGDGNGGNGGGRAAGVAGAALGAAALGAQAGRPLPLACGRV